MKKHRYKKKIIEELKKLPIISVVCQKVGVSRNTYYRWYDEDSDFKKMADEALAIGISSINDLAGSKLIGSIQKSESWAIKYWLSNNKENYIHPRAKDFWDKEVPVNKVEVEIISTREQKELLEKIEELTKRLRKYEDVPDEDYTTSRELGHPDDLPDF